MKKTFQKCITSSLLGSIFGKSYTTLYNKIKKAIQEKKKAEEKKKEEAKKKVAA